MRAILKTITASLVPLLLVACDTANTPEATPPDSSAEAPASSPPAPAVLARGGRFLGINGIHFGPDGLLYLASAVTPSIASVDVDTGRVMEEFRGSKGVKDPDDLAFGPDGSVYWTNILTGTIVRRSPDRSVTVVAEPGPGVNPITFSDDGRLFVSQCFLDYELFEIDPQGTTAPRVVTDQLGPACGLNGMDWGPDGLLYGPRWFNGEVVKVNVETGEFETAASGFEVPAAVKFDSQGRLHVLDSLPGEVVRVDLATGDKTVVGRVTPSTADNLAFNAEDRLFVSSFGDGWIVEIMDEGTNRTVIPGGQINIPGGLAWVDGPAGPVLYVADFFALRGLDPATGDGKYVARDIIGFSGLGSTFTVSPRGSHLVLSSWFDQAVRIWDPANDMLIAKFVDFEHPVDAVSFGEQILVSDAGTGRVIAFNPADDQTRVTIASGLEKAGGLAVAGTDVFVSDIATGSVYQIIAQGEALAPPRMITNSLESPEGIAATEEALYIVESGARRVTKIDRQSFERTTIMEGLVAHHLLFDGIAIGGDGRVYVTGGKANSIYVLEP